MKKSYFLSVLMGLGFIAALDAGQSRRPEAYTLIDEEITIDDHVIPRVNWNEVFKIIDLNPGIIRANQYYTEAGDTLLLLAVGNNSLSAAKKLLEKYKVDPNQTFNDEYPLIWALQRSDAAMVKLLLHHGADPDVKNEYQSAFQAAQSPKNLKYHLNLLEMLIKRSKKLHPEEEALVRKLKKNSNMG